MPGFWNLSVSHFDFAKATQNRGGAKSTPALSLSQVYGAIAYYLDHQTELDRVSCAKRSSTPRRQVRTLGMVALKVSWTGLLAGTGKVRTQGRVPNRLSGT
jgi:hypothetical protein